MMPRPRIVPPLKPGLALAAALTLAGTLANVPTARASDPRANDGGINDLVIHLASDRPGGVPEVEFTRIRSQLDRLGIAIPPAVHVHRYYYNGNKQYQGPYVVGGPTVIVARHPRTNEQVYIEAQLPSGYPEIAYDDCSITYIYPERRVQVKFLPGHADKFAVTYLPGRGLALRLHERGRIHAERHQEARQTSPLRRSLAEARTEVRETTRGLFVTTGGVLARGTQTVGQVVSAAPGLRTLRSQGRQAIVREQQARFHTAVERARTEEDIEFRPTVR
jgi:hypothetical protein